jgi:hypothetical protein
LDVLDCAFQVPIGFDHVAGLVIVVGNELGALLLAVSRWFTDVVQAASKLQGGHIHFGELEMIGPEESAFFRLGV